MWRSIVDIEKPDGAVVQFGGQTAIKLTEALMKMGVPILGTSAEDVDAAEDRELFDEILEKCQIPRPAGTYRIHRGRGEARQPMSWAIRFWFVLPTYWADRACRSPSTTRILTNTSASSTVIAQEHPILVDKYLVGKEIEVDAVCDGEDILIPGIMEHIERAGIHSGDSISVYPAPSLNR